MARWKTIPLFISSTFKDMHAERDALHAIVFPALAERLRARRCRLEPIDLRVGVEPGSDLDDEARELAVLKVCLDEVHRSRPFLLVLLGDRYGTVPPAERIATAAQLQGFETDPHNMSVTALEIEFGLLQRDPTQHRRCLICLREPLPYEKLGAKAAVFSDANDPAAGSAERARHLTALKQRLTTNLELKAHLFPYTLGWDEAKMQPTGLEAWARAIEEKLWSTIAAEATALAPVDSAEPTPDEEERFALEEFIERHERGFVGRIDSLAEAFALVRSDATGAGAPRALCFTGESGAGKSALFAQLHATLTFDPVNHSPTDTADEHQAKVAAGSARALPPLLVLAHAAGVSPRSSLVGAMLRRWVGELDGFLGSITPLPDDLPPEELEKTFGRLLHLATAQRRVVILVDALNQFERTGRAMELSWLPALWPDNARFIATAIAGRESARLAHVPGVTLAALPPLASADAESLAAQIYARYHRQPPVAVVRALLARTRADGTPACGHPLWLTFALELLNLVDTDDFEAVSRGPRELSSVARLQAHLLARVTAMSPDFEGLFSELIADAERLVGPAWVRPFLALLAFSRNGWREEDLAHLLPLAAPLLCPNEPAPVWETLRFAILRRSFRGLVIQCGDAGQWQFTHASLRPTVLRRLEGDWLRDVGATSPLAPALHRLGVAWLSTMEPGASVRRSELVWQVAGMRDPFAFTTFFADVGRTASEWQHLGTYLAEDNDGTERSLARFVVGIVDHERTPDPPRIILARQLMFNLSVTLEVEGNLALRGSLLEALVRFYERLRLEHQEDEQIVHDFSSAKNTLGEFYLRRNEADDAGRSLVCFREALSVTLGLLQGATPSVRILRDIAVSLKRSGDLLVRRSDKISNDGALEIYTLAHEFTGKLHEMIPDDPQTALDLSASLIDLGDYYQHRGGHDTVKLACTYYEQSLAIRQKLCELHPDRPEFAFQKAVPVQRLTDLLQRHGDLSSTSRIRAFLQELHDLMERLFQQSPNNLEFARGLATAHAKLGDFHLRHGPQHNPDTALQNFERSRDIMQRLHEENPGDHDLAREFSLSLRNIGAMMRRRGQPGDLDRALDIYERCLQVTGPVFERDVSYEKKRIRDVVRLLCDVSDLYQERHRQGDEERALQHLKQCEPLLEHLREANPEDEEIIRDHSMLLMKQGRFFMDRGQTGDLEQAQRGFGEALELRRQLYKNNSESAQLTGDFASALAAMGLAYLRREGSGFPDQAIDYLEQARGLLRGLHDKGVGGDNTASDYSDALINLGSAYLGRRQASDRQSARQCFQTCDEILQRLYGRSPDNAGLVQRITTVLQSFAVVAVLDDQPTEARKCFERAATLQMRLIASKPTRSDFKEQLAVTYFGAGTALRKADPGAARNFFKQSYELLNTLAAANQLRNPSVRDLLPLVNEMFSVPEDSGLAHRKKAMECETLGDRRGAIENMEKASDAFLAQTDQATDMTSMVSIFCNLADCLTIAGDWTKDVGLLESAIEAATKVMPAAKQQGKAAAFTYAALTHNCGHARFVLGEIKSDTKLIKTGIDEINAAMKMFADIGHKQAMLDSGALAIRATVAYARVMGLDVDDDFNIRKPPS